MWFVTEVALAQAMEEVEVVHQAADFDAATTAASVTIVRVEDLPASADLAAAVGSAPGAVVRRLGGLGAWSAVSIRGSATRQVEVFLDGVPLNPDGGSTINLSELPVRAFERIEIYRGAAPPELGTAAMGGAVNLVTGDARTAEVAASGGSHATAAGRALWSGPVAAGHDAFVVADGLITRADFTYFDDRATPYTLADDRTRRRVNNDTRQLAAHTRWRASLGALEVTLLNALLLREEGVPGYTWAPARQVRYAVARDLPAASLEGAAGAWWGRALIWSHWRRERLRDPAGEIGVGRGSSQDTALQLGGRGALRWVPSANAAGVATVEVRGDQHQPDGPAPRSRRVLRSGLGLTLLALDEHLSLSPVVLASWLTGFDDRAATTASVDPRMGALLQITEALAVKANVGRTLRPPDLVELFGDRGALVGNPNLRPERGTQGDLGLAMQSPRGKPLTARLEATGFGGVARDRIVYVQNARVAVPHNLDRSSVLGAESAAVLGLWDRLEGRTQVTLTRSRILSEDVAYAGNQLPRVPLWEGAHTTAATLGSLRLGHSVSWTAGTYEDATNWYRTAPRVFHGLFAVLEDPTGRGAIALDLLNITDRIAEDVAVNPLDPDSALAPRAVTDFSGYPLPGRTLLLTVRWRP